MKADGVAEENGTLETSSPTLMLKTDKTKAQSSKNDVPNPHSSLEADWKPERQPPDF